jgi:methylated-DNA-[protein]-cysteine S-methyltransferase
LQFGHASEVAAKRALVAAESAESLTVAWSQPDRLAQGWIRELKNYASGKQASLADLPIEEAGMTPFQRSVRVACRKVKRGEVMTYGELARKVGRPGAARAVGSVMSGNPTPLIVPCHRVLGANGLGGYSAPQGISMKLHLLDLEGAIEHVDCDCEHC